MSRHSSIDVFSEGDEKAMNGGEGISDGRWEDFSESEQIAVYALGSLSGTSRNSTPFSPLTSPPMVSPMTNGEVFHFMSRSPPHLSEFSGRLPMQSCTSVYQRPQGLRKSPSSHNSQSSFSSFPASMGSPYSGNPFTYNPSGSVFHMPSPANFVDSNSSNSNNSSSPMNVVVSSRSMESKVTNIKCCMSGEGGGGTFMRAPLSPCDAYRAP